MDQFDYLTVVLGISVVGVAAFVMTRPKPKSSEGTYDVSSAGYQPMEDPVADLRRQARQLNIPEDAIERFVRKYMASGLSEELALQKIIEDTVKDRARYRA